LPAKGAAGDDHAQRSEIMAAYFGRVLNVRRLGRSIELLKWLTADEQFSSSTARKSIDGQRGPRTELNTCVVKFTLHNSVDANLMEILSRYSIDTAHFCFAISVVVDGKTVAQSDLFYDLKSPDLKPLFIPINLLPEDLHVTFKLMVLSDESRMEVSSISSCKLVDGSGGQFTGLFESGGNAIVELRSKSRLTFMKSDSAADKVDHGFTFHLQANEAVTDNNQPDRALALNLVALSWWQRHKMLHAVFCKVLMEVGSLYFLLQDHEKAVSFLEAGLAFGHRLKLSNQENNHEFFQSDTIADGLQELAMARLFKGDMVRSISCLLEALHLKQQFYLEEELDDAMLETAANKMAVLYTQLLFVINEALSSGLNS
jgi:hypothetical protein